MKLRISVYLVLILFTSCSERIRFPEKLSNKIPLEELQFPLSNSNIQNSTLSNNVKFTSLQKYVDEFNSKNENFNLEEFESQWNLLLAANSISEWNDAELNRWADMTGLLLELTNNAEYAEELENIILNSEHRLDRTLAPYIFTKRIDHIYVNLFEPLEINYRHTLGGDVKFSQECNYPESGSIKMHFGMTERRYIELYIRIPSWAEGATVTVKKVKYFAAPGSYCLIAKKWKEGDLVEVEFPMDKYTNVNRP